MSKTSETNTFKIELFDKTGGFVRFEHLPIGEDMKPYEVQDFVEYIAKEHHFENDATLILIHPDSQDNERSKALIEFPSIINLS